MIKNLCANASDAKEEGTIPRLGRSPGVGNGTPLQHSCQKNSRDRGAWWATVHGVTKQLNTTKQLKTHPLNVSSIFFPWRLPHPTTPSVTSKMLPSRELLPESNALEIG